MTNWREYIAGTSPTNRLDFLRFQSATISNSSCVLQFTPRAGRTYAIERLDALAPVNSWATLLDNITGTNLVTVSDPLVPSASFYRLKARLSP
jgi:hypothetical protein